MIFGAFFWYINATQIVPHVCIVHVSCFQSLLHSLCYLWSHKQGLIGNLRIRLGEANLQYNFYYKCMDSYYKYVGEQVVLYLHTDIKFGQVITLHVCITG